MCKKLLSVIVPVFNVEKEYLLKCFDSLKMQSLDCVDYIIVDDGSNEVTAKICDEYWELDCRAQVIHQENMGLAGARNTGMKIASGEYILFLDSDDWLEDSDSLTSIEKVISTNKLDVYFFKHKINQPTMNKKYCGSFLDEYTIEKLQRTIIRKSNLGCDIQIASAWAKVFNRDFLTENRLEYDVELRRTQDRYFMFQVLQANPRIDLFDNVVMCFNTLNENSLSRKYNDKNVEYLMLYFEKLRNYVNVNELTQFYSDLEFLHQELFFEVCLHTVFHYENNMGRRQKYNQFMKIVEKFRKQGIEFNTNSEFRKNENKVISLAKKGLWNRCYAKLNFIGKIERFKVIIKKVMK